MPSSGRAVSLLWRGLARHHQEVRVKGLGAIDFVEQKAKRVDQAAKNNPQRKSGRENDARQYPLAHRVNDPVKPQQPEGGPNAALELQLLQVVVGREHLAGAVERKSSVVVRHSVFLKNKRNRQDEMAAGFENTGDFTLSGLQDYEVHQ